MPWPAYLKAMVYCGLDRQKEAQAQLEKSSQARDYLLPVTLGLLSMYDFPGVENFVASPRFQALRAKIKVD